MAKVNYNDLKKGGFMRQVQKDNFSMRLRVVGGQIKAEQLKGIYEIAEKYGQGYVHMTSRQGVEIPFIKADDIDEVKELMAQFGLQPGSCGPRVRTITACQGCTICPSGLIDTTALAGDFDERYFAWELPHKFKLGITGCRNNCLKAEENDIGVKGGFQPEWVADQCSFCGLCEVVCPTKAISIDKPEQQLVFAENKCNYCGRCAKSCPTGGWKGKSGFLVYFGGLFGNRITVGRQLLPILFKTEDLHKVIEVTLAFFQKHGKQSERFGDTLDRVGWDLLSKELEGVVS